MLKKALRTSALGVLATSVVACSAAPTQPEGSTAASGAASMNAPVVELPMKATEQELVAPQKDGAFDTQQVRTFGGRRYRFRRTIISGYPYYVPYYYPSYYSYYTPYYTYYDPYYYYTPAYYYPYFGGRRIIIRYRRPGSGGGGGGNDNNGNDNNDNDD